MSAEVKALLERFDHLRNSGVCSPTTRGLLDDAQALLAALSSPPADDVREALDGEAKALMGRLWAAADNAGVSREAVEFEWPECHKPKCQSSHGLPDVAMSYMKRAIMAEIEAELRYRVTSRPDDRAPETDTPERAAAFHLAILLRNHNVRDEGTFIRAAERIVEAYPELVPVFSGREVRLRGTVTDAEALRLGKVAWVAFQEDKSWAESVVEDCFSPADDLPEEALDMIAVARAVAGAVTGVDALAKAWDAGVRTAGAYGHEDTWTHDMTPYTENPFRGEARS